MTPDVVWHAGSVARTDRPSAGTTVWFTGLSGSGKSTVAAEACTDPPLTTVSHYIRRVGEVARLFADAGVVALVPVISPYRADRDRARAIHEAVGLRFVEVFVDTPLALCESRDPKGLYAKARAGEIVGFTGVDDPYEVPEHPDLRLTPADGDPPAQAALVLDELDGR